MSAELVRIVSIGVGVWCGLVVAYAFIAAIDLLWRTPKVPAAAIRDVSARGRGEKERASFALGSERLDKFHRRCRNNNISATKGVASLMDALLDGKLVLINGVGELLQLLPEGGVGEPFAKMIGSPSVRAIPEVQLRSKSSDGGTEFG